MGERESLLVVLALIYLSECLVWVRRGALALGAWWGRSFRLLQPGGWLGNARGGWLLANPFPPLGAVFLTPWIPFSLSPEVAFAWSAACLGPGGRPAHTARLLRFEEITEIAVDGRDVLVNKAIFLRATSSFAARRWAEWLQRWHAAPQRQRAERIKRDLRESLAADRIDHALKELGSRAGPLRFLSNALFVYLFGAVVPLVWHFGFGRFALWLLVGMLAQTVTIAFVFRRAHRALYPGADEERFKPFVTMLLAPPTAIRAPDLLARHLLEGVPPLAAARALCPSPVFKEFARRSLLDLRYPLLPVCPRSDPAATAAEHWFRAAQLEAAEDFLRQANIDPGELASAPGPSDPSSRSFCPRCGAQYVVPNGTCPDCGGRDLVGFKRSGAEGLKG